MDRFYYHFADKFCASSSPAHMKLEFRPGSQGLQLNRPD